jgi:tripartite ATP-independent transporter DctM subunit
MDHELNRVMEKLKRVIVPVSRWFNGFGTGILAFMMFLTFADVVLRYLFSSPIPGSLEITEFMLAIFVSSSLAYTEVNKGHINVDIAMARLPKRAQAVINCVTSILSLVIFALITWQSIIYAAELRQGNETSGVLHIPSYPFVYVLSLSSLMLCLIFIINLFESISQTVAKLRRQVWLGLLVVAILAVMLLTAPAWMGALKGKVDPVTAGIFGIIYLMIMLFSGMRIGVVMLSVGFVGMAYVIGVNPGLSNLGNSPYSTVSSYGFSVIPLFILMGLFCFHSGLSKDLYYTVYKWLGRLPGGLAMATIGACAGFAAVSGSSVATVATMGTVSLPEMKKYKYDPALATGVIAAGGCLGILIPPSVPLVVYGILTEQSIGKLFLAGFIPGILQAILFIMAIYVHCKRNPLAGPPGESSNIKDKLISLKGTWGILFLFLLVIGGLYVGIFTPREAAGVGAFGAFIIAVARKQLSFRNFKASLIETAQTTSMIFLILIGAIVLGYFLAVTRLPSELANYVSGIAVNRYIILLLMIVVYLFLGCIIASTAIIILTVPIFFPLITSLEFDPIWFGIIVILMVEMGQITPPVGLNVFVLQGIAKDVPMYTIFRGIVPFFFASVILTLILIFFPEIVLFLPNLMK